MRDEDEEDESPSTGDYTDKGTVEIPNKAKAAKEPELINNENTINKITITVYQRRHHMPQPWRKNKK